MSLRLPALSGFQAEGWNGTSLCSPQQPPQSVHMLLLRQPVLLCFPGSGQEVSLKKGIPQAYIRARTWGGGRGGNATQCEGAKMTMWRGKAAGPDWPDSNYTQSRLLHRLPGFKPTCVLHLPLFKMLWNVSQDPTARCQTSKTLRAERGAENSSTAFTVSPLRLVACLPRLLCEETCLSRRSVAASHKQQCCLWHKQGHRTRDGPEHS